MLEGRPVIVAGDGSTPWTLTRSQDFARPFVGLFGKSAALGEDLHITSDNAYAWHDIYETIAAGLGVKADIVYVPTDTLVSYHPEWEGPLLGDKTWPALFDNAKVKQVAGDFGAVKNLGHLLADPIAHVKIRLLIQSSRNEDLDSLIDRITRQQRALGAGVQ